MTAIVVGAGSAALHFADACEALGTEYTVVTRSVARRSEFVSRFTARYGSPPQCSFLDLRNSADRQFDIGLVATPPISHGEVAEYLLQFGPKLIFIDKPLGMQKGGTNRVLTEGVRLLCGSQLVLRPSFEAFAARSVEMLTAPDAEVHSRYCEPLSGPVLAHPWDSSFANGWVTDEQSGGGVLSEFCHALFWVGWLLEANGFPLNMMQLDDFATQTNGRGRISLSKVAMSIRPVDAPRVSVFQSWQTDTLDKSLSVTSEASSFQLRLESGTESDRLVARSTMASPYAPSEFPTDRRSDTERLLHHIIQVSQSPHIDSPLSLTVAIWVEQVITNVRRSAAL